MCLLQVTSVSMSMKMDGVSFISPKPGRRRSIFNLIHPLGYEVWAASLASFAAVAAACRWAARGEERLMGLDLREWSTWPEAAWFALGTFVGENIAKEGRRFSRANALRCENTRFPRQRERSRYLYSPSLNNRFVVACWMLFSFILTAGYGGSLRAFLLKPDFNDPIDNMEDIVEGALPWNIVLYGVELDNYLETSPDPVVRQFWEGKTVVEYDDFPFQRVRSGKHFLTNINYHLFLPR